MNITGFYPMIATADADSIVKVFEEMGFEICHDFSGTTETDYRLVVMEDGSGHRVDIAEAGTEERDRILVRMNVDDFEAAYEILVRSGYVNTRGDKRVISGSAVEATMVSPSGQVISLIQHMKKPHRQNSPGA